MFLEKFEPDKQYRFSLRQYNRHASCHNYKASIGWPERISGKNVVDIDYVYQVGRVGIFHVSPAWCVEVTSELADFYVAGKRYKFSLDRYKQWLTAQGYSFVDDLDEWALDVDGMEVTVDIFTNSGEVNGYGISPVWCEEIKEIKENS